ADHASLRSRSRRARRRSRDRGGARGVGVGRVRRRVVATPLASFMSLPPQISSRLRLPVFGAPMFLVSGPDLVIEQCKAGVIGSFPSLNVRPQEELDKWLTRIETELAQFQREHPDRKVAPYAVNLIVNKANKRLDADLEVVLNHKVS